MVGAPNVTHDLTPTTNVWSTDTWTNGAPINVPGDIAQWNTAGTATTSLDVAVTLGQLQTGTTAGSIWSITAGGGAFTFDGTGITSGNEAFGNAGVAAIASRNTGGNLAVTPDISFGATALDIGATSTGTVTIGGNITATAAQSLTFRGSGSGILTINGNIGATGSSIAVTNNRSSGGNVVINGILGPNVGSVTQTGSSATSQMTFNAANTYAGATLIDRGVLNLNGSGAAANSAFTLGTVGNPSSGTPILNINPSTGGTITRGSSLTVNGVLSSSARNLVVTGVASTTNDRFTGNLTLNPGIANVQITSNATAGVTTTLSFGGLVRNAGSTVNLYDGTGGGTIGGTGTANTAKLIFGTAPTLSGTGTAGTTSQGILPYVLVADSGGASFGTYDANGIRKLDVTTEMAALTASGFTAGQNAKVVGTTTVLTGDATVNSLFGGDSGGSDSKIGLGGFTINVTSGGVMSNSGNSSVSGTGGFIIGTTQNDGVLNFGTVEGILNVADYRLLTINSVIQGSGGLTIDMTRLGFQSSLALNGTNTFTGTTRITGSGSNSALMRIQNGLALQNSTLDYNNYGGYFTFGTPTGVNGVTATDVTSATFGGLTGAQTIALTNSGAAGGGVALTLGSAGTGFTAATVNTYSGILSGTGSITKAGLGTQVFSGANTYSGGTTISGGKLQLINTSGSGTGTGAVALSGGTSTTLAGTGSSSGLLTVTAGSRLAPGVNTTGANANFGVAGTLRLGSTGGLTLTNASLDFDLSSTGGGASVAANDHVTTAGALTLGTLAFTFNELNGSLAVGTAYTLISGEASQNGFSAANISTSFLNGAAYTPTYSLAGNDLTVSFAAVAVPEPRTWVFGGLLTGIALIRCYRRRKA